jgi:hypothetical protein
MLAVICTQAPSSTAKTNYKDLHLHQTITDQNPDSLALAKMKIRKSKGQLQKQFYPAHRH